VFVERLEEVVARAEEQQDEADVACAAQQRDGEEHPELRVGPCKREGQLSGGV